MPLFVGIRDGAVFVGHKSYSGLVYRGISDPSRRSTLIVVGYPGSAPIRWYTRWGFLRSKGKGRTHAAGMRIFGCPLEKGI